MSLAQYLTLKAYGPTRDVEQATQRALALQARKRELTLALTTGDCRTGYRRAQALRELSTLEGC